MVSNSSMSHSLPVPPPAARNEISRNRPISRIVFGAVCASTTYMRLWPLLVGRSRRSGVSSDSISSVDTGGMIVSSITMSAKIHNFHDSGKFHLGGSPSAVSLSFDGARGDTSMAPLSHSR